MKSQMTRRSFMAATGLSALTLAACGGSSDGGEVTPSEQSDADIAAAGAKVEMITDTGGVNDQGFNELSWAGLQELATSEGYEVSYLESKQESDYATNLDKAIDDGSDMVWGIGFAMAEATEEAADVNPDIPFACIDGANSNGTANFTGVLFSAQEPSFIVGYIAGRCTQANKVGFVGGVKSESIEQFEYGYLAGVAYAANELGKDIATDSQYAESFADAAKGKSIAQKMFTDGADIVYHAAGGTGVGVIEAADEAGDGMYAIGVDKDQSFLAPESVLTSALKRVDQAIINLTPQLISGELEGGQTITLTFADGDYLGIPEEHSLMGDEVYDAAIALIDQIKDGTITVPDTKATYDEFVAAL